MSDNPKSILICGESGHGKSASLMGIADRKDVLYFNCENGKPLPFKNNFKKKTITDPEDLLDFLDELIEMEEEGNNPFKFIIVDTVSFLMDLFESTYVIGSANTQKAWGDYGQFFPKLMVKTAKLDSFFIFLGHLDSYLDEDEGIMKYSVPVKGALARKGLEARFTTVLYVKKMRIKDILKGIGGTPSKLLNITPKEEGKGYKHVFLTDSDKNTIGGRIRTPLGMFKDDELYIDNDVFPVLKRLTEYYAED
jgi:hypothetical protein